MTAVCVSVPSAVWSLDRLVSKLQASGWGELDGPALHDHLEGLLSPYLEREIDVVALGCTHFPFLKTAIARFFPADTAFIDGSARTLQDLMAALWEKDLLTAKKEPGTTAFRTSGGQETLRLMEMLSY